ncbi:MAG TPA: 2-C-methyl-D-erythritol 4-phosphate cytidylyltransferase [Pyrinomonadaceae bacterium]|nr:2-C-methyl-D-erythritol 4-phosphate cytidylyltransferase [Pyrinomonadaceae bacterium]
MNVAIIAAAGQGSRMGGRRAKQYLELAGTPIIIHTLQAFEACEAIQEIILVLPEADVSDFSVLARSYKCAKVRAVVPGGATRASSVWHGLQAITPNDSDIVVVHDGSRPLVTTTEITQTVRAAEVSGASILVAPIVDTVKETRDGSVVRTIPRAHLRRALTPQCFRYSILRRAYEEVDVLDPTLTDESALVERLGVPVTVVEGSSQNIKITRPEDLLIAEALLRQKARGKRQ